jgi:hypothetical protein
VEDRLTENSCGREMSNRKQLWWRNVRLCFLANDPLSLVPNDLSNEELMEATSVEDALLRWQQSLHDGTKGACRHVSSPTLELV